MKNTQENNLSEEDIGEMNKKHLDILDDIIIRKIKIWISKEELNKRITYVNLKELE